MYIGVIEKQNKATGMDFKKCIWLFVFIILSAGTICAQNEVDLTKENEGIIVLSHFHGIPKGVDGVIHSCHIILPAYKQGCFFTSDVSWPGWANRAQGVVFDKSPEEIYEQGNKPIPAVGSFVREGIMLLLHLTDGRYMSILPLTSESAMSWLYVEEDGLLTLKTGTMGTAEVKGDFPLVAWSCTKDIYEAIHNTWEQAFSNEQIRGRTTWRNEKVYPEPFKYLGWCSWEQFRKNINEKILVDAVQDIEKSDVPVRWILVDDGHQEAVGNSLVSFQPSPEKFPDGWNPILSLRKKDKIEWFGLWHCFNGLWDNIDKQNKLYSLKNDLMPSKDGNTLIVKDNDASIDHFYETMIGTVKKQGFDFVKIDVQTSAIGKYQGYENAVYTSVKSTEALERECNTTMDNQLINCMAHNPACMFNTTYSAATRASIDYEVGNLAKAVSHIYQSYAMSLYLGQTVWPDHDMFHSNDHVSGQVMAISKAMSGAPVYLSDAPNDINKSNVMPLCYNDGQLLRPLAPAVPLPSSIFNDHFTQPNLYEVIAPLSNGCASLVIYNLNYPGSTRIEGKVSPSAYRYASALLQPYSGGWTIPEEGLVLFDWIEQKGQVFSRDYKFSLTGFANKLLHLCPIQNGWAVVGRSDKYLSPAAVKKIRTFNDRLELLLEESGPLVIWLRKGVPVSDGITFKSLGNGFWKCQLPENRKEYSIIIMKR